MTKATLAKAYRAARHYHGESPVGPHPYKRPAHLAIAEARRRLARVDLARAEYLAANPQSGDADAPGALPIDAGEGHKARSAYVDALAYAGAFHTAQSYAPERPGWSDDGTALHPGTWPAFRDVCAVHDLPDSPIDHRGHYDNPHAESWRDGSGLVWGVVAHVSRGRYLAGWQHGGVDGGPTFATGRGFFDCPRDAAYYADGLAERAAEQERDYQEAWQAGQRWAELGEEIETRRRKTLDLLRQNRESGGSRDLPAIHATIKAAVCDAWRAICEARAERAQLALDHDHRDGWTDGAGCA